MAELTVPLLIAVAVLLCAIMLVQGLNRTVEFLSIRNLYLCGFIVAQIISPLRAIWTDMGGLFFVENRLRAAETFLGYTLVFLPVFFLVYHKTFFWKWAARRTQLKPTTSPDAALLALAVMLVVVGFGARFSTQFVPVIRNVTYHQSIGLAAVASGLVGWVWSRRRANLGVIGIGAVIFAMAIGAALWGAYGRRPLLTVVLGLAWGAYYGFGHRLRPASLMAWSLPLLLIGGVLASGFTAIRARASGGELSPQQIALGMVDLNNIKRGAADMMAGQACGEAALWCIENYPDVQQPRPLFSARQVFQQFVPKMIWPDKPKPLANHIAKLANIKGVNHEKITIPPGVIGYGAAEGGLYAVIFYAVFFGGFTRFFDEIVRLNSSDAFLVTACGCALGHFLGLARGDLANFTVNILLSIVTTVFVVWLLRLLIGRQIQERLVYWHLAPAGREPHQP